jgi:hypothetical protein
MMPLCTTTTEPALWGCALRSDGLPWVAQRVWPTPTRPAIGRSRSAASRLASLPTARRIAIDPFSKIATPAES